MNNHLGEHLQFVAQIEALSAEPDDPKQFAALENLLLTSPVARRVYGEWSQLQIDLRQMVRAEEAFGLLPLCQPEMHIDTGSLWLGPTVLTGEPYAPRGLLDRFGTAATMALTIAVRASSYLLATALRAPLISGSLAVLGLLGIWLTISWVILTWFPGDRGEPAVAQNENRGEEATNVFGTVAATVDCRWGTGHASLAPGAQLVAGPMQLVAGAVQFAVANSTKLTVQGPAEFEFEDAHTVHVARGQFAARVSPQGIGFTVQTPTAKIVDLGTEFCVAVGQDGETEVHVLTGRVAMYPGGRNDRHVEELVLRAGEAAKITRDGYELNLPPEGARFVRDPLQVRAARSPSGLPLPYPTPLARWDLAEAGGVNVADRSGRFSGVIRNPDGLRWLQNGLEFSGQEKTFVDFGDDAALAPEKMTVSIWIKLSSEVADSARMAIFSKRLPDPEENVKSSCWEVAIDWQRKIVFRVFSGKDSVFVGKGDTGCAAEQIQDGRWHHLACTYDGQLASLYVDGQLIDQQPVPAGINQIDAPLYLGQYTIESLQPKNALHGCIGGPLMIFDDALTAEQVKALLAEIPRN